MAIFFLSYQDFTCSFLIGFVQLHRHLEPAIVTKTITDLRNY